MKCPHRTFVVTSVNGPLARTAVSILVSHMYVFAEIFIHSKLNKLTISYEINIKKKHYVIQLHTTYKPFNFY